MIVVDMDFILTHPDGELIIKDYDDEGNPIYREAWETLSENIMEKDIQRRREIGQEAIADSWEKAKAQLIKSKRAELSQEEHDYFKLFLTDDVVAWIGTIKQQFLSAFN